MAIGEALAGYLLSQYGYVPNVAQSLVAIRGLRLTASDYPALAIILCVDLLFIHGINKPIGLYSSNL